MENRLTQRLISYWELLKKEKECAEFAHFNSSAISDIWPQCVLLLVQPATSGAASMLQIQNIGENLKPLFGQEWLGKSISSLHRQFPAAAIIRRAQEMIDSPHIVTDEGQFVNRSTKVVKFRSCLIPFLTKERVSHIVVGLSWREF